VRCVSDLLSKSEPILDLLAGLDGFYRHHALIYQSIFSAPISPAPDQSPATLPVSWSLPPAHEVERLCDEWREIWSQRLSPINEAFREIKWFRALDEVWKSNEPGQSVRQRSSSARIKPRSERSLRSEGVSDDSDAAQSMQEDDLREDRVHPNFDKDVHSVGRNPRKERRCCNPLAISSWVLAQITKRWRSRQFLPIFGVVSLALVFACLVRSRRYPRNTPTPTPTRTPTPTPTPTDRSIDLDAIITTSVQRLIPSTIFSDAHHSQSIRIHRLAPSPVSGELYVNNHKDLTLE
jgi:hypothetical protein